jgi:hypothetical protein
MGVFENRVLRRIFGPKKDEESASLVFFLFARFHLCFSVLFSSLILLFLACVLEKRQADKHTQETTK